MDIWLDRTIVLQQCILILLASLGLLLLVLRLIRIHRVWFSSTSQGPFIPGLASTNIIIYCHLDCWVLLGRYVWRELPSQDLALVYADDFSITKDGHGKHFGESLSEQLSGHCQSCCQKAAVRVAAAWVAAVRELLSMGFGQSGCCQRASVRVAAVGVKVTD